MHTIAIRREIVERNPWVPMNLFKAFELAKKRSVERVLNCTSSVVPIPWGYELAHKAQSIVGDDLMLRLGREESETALDEPHVRPMDFTGRPMRGMVYVGAPGLTTDEALAGWVARALRHASTLPPKR